MMRSTPANYEVLLWQPRRQQHSENKVRKCKAETGEGKKEEKKHKRKKKKSTIEARANEKVKVNFERVGEKKVGSEGAPRKMHDQKWSVW